MNPIKNETPLSSKILLAKKIGSEKNEVNNDEHDKQIMKAISAFNYSISSTNVAASLDN